MLLAVQKLALQCPEMDLSLNDVFGVGSGKEWNKMAEAGNIN